MRVADYYEVEPVAAHPQFGTVGPPGWGFNAYSQLDEDDAPHRALLERFAKANPDYDLSLPEAEQDEDFVDGTLSCGQDTAYIYYETLLSHLWIWSASQDFARCLREGILATTQTDTC